MISTFDLGEKFNHFATHYKNKYDYKWETYIRIISYLDACAETEAITWETYDNVVIILDDWYDGKISDIEEVERLIKEVEEE